MLPPPGLPKSQEGTGSPGDIHNLLDEPADLLQIPGGKQRRGTLKDGHGGRRLTGGSGDKGDTLKSALTPTFTELRQHAAAAGHPLYADNPGDTPTNQPSEFSFAGAGGGGGENTDRSRQNKEFNTFAMAQE